MKIPKPPTRHLAYLISSLLMLASLPISGGGAQRIAARVQDTPSHADEGQHGTSIESLLNADGTLNLGAGFTGSLDPAGWEMVEGEQPRFVRSGDTESSRQGVDAFGDQNWDDSFGLPGVSGTVYAITIAGADVYVGGTFTTADNITANYIARWDGTHWHSLGAGLYDDIEGGYVFAIVVSGSDVYVGGDFIRAGDVPANGIARWDGAQWHPLGNGVISGNTNGFVYDIKIVGNDVYVGGGFGTAGDIDASGIARWDGTQWSSVGGGVSYNGGCCGVVNSMAVSGSNLYIAGDFNRVGDVIANRIARWDGNQWSSLGEGSSNGISDYIVYAVAANGDDVYVGGSFTMAGGVPAHYLAHWNGVQWGPLGGTDYGPNSEVRTIAINGNDIYVGGYFSTAGGIEARRVVRWNGSQWYALGASVSSAGSTVVYVITTSGDDIYVGGAFTVAGSVNASRIARWDGAQWSAVGSGSNNGVHGSIDSIALGDDGVYVGGILTRTGNIEVGSIARWDGTQWSPLGSGVTSEPSQRPEVSAIALNGDDVYIGGYFFTAGGVSANYVARWDGTQWSPLGSGTNGRVNALAFRGGYLYAGGLFSMAGGVPANSIARWDGAQWSSLGSGANNGVNSEVYALAGSGADLYVGGYFNAAGGATANRIARWNGSSWSALGSGVNNVVRSLAAQGADIYAGGIFTMAGGISANRIAKWDGSQWTPLGSGVSDCLAHSCTVTVNALAIGLGGVYAAGQFLQAGGIEVNHIARWDGNQWLPLGSGVSSLAQAITINSTSNEMYVGGWFTVAGGKSSNGLGLWHATCLGSFSDVPPDNTFYPYVLCLACQSIVGGYDDGTFRPNNSITRGQLSKIVSNAAGFSYPPGEQLFEDVAPGSPFYDWVQRLAGQGYISGYPCGGEGEPCGPDNLPYFRPNANATRGQISKIVSNAAGFSDPAGEQRFEDVSPGSPFYDWVQRLASRSVMGGYPCGGPNEPCIQPDNRPYFRPSANATRGQTSKIVANTFFPDCNPPAEP